MSTDERRRELRELLDLAEDFYRDGFRRVRPPEPEAPPEQAAGLVPAAEGAQQPVEQPAVRPTASELSGLTLAEVAARVSVCTRCGLGRLRKTAVPGEGVPSPLVLAVGEAPGADEDASGRPFVGAAGQYLDKWLAAIGLDRKTNCFIANVIKCRPPGNRNPAPDEVSACRGYLERQIELLRPRAILALGRTAAQALLESTRGINELRAGTHTYRGLPLVATFHPSAVLRDSSLRQLVWDDLRRLKALLGNG